MGRIAIVMGVCTIPIGAVAEPCVSWSFDTPVPTATDVVWDRVDVPTANYPGYWQSGRIQGTTYLLFSNLSGNLAASEIDPEWVIELTCQEEGVDCLQNVIGTPTEEALEVATLLGQCMQGVQLTAEQVRAPFAPEPEPIPEPQDDPIPIPEPEFDPLALLLRQEALVPAAAAVSAALGAAQAAAEAAELALAEEKAKESSDPLASGTPSETLVEELDIDRPAATTTVPTADESDVTVVVDVAPSAALGPSILPPDENALPIPLAIIEQTAEAYPVELVATKCYIDDMVEAPDGLMLQRLIAIAGENPGPRDGLIGPKTRRAAAKVLGISNAEVSKLSTAEMLAEVKANLCASPAKAEAEEEGAASK